ncbi:MAG: hypothetical protein K2M10_03675, partial [Muribaculaceae bacterium]|nr:hypothetical protein [Muribaculaceae bacterium]
FYQFGSSIHAINFYLFYHMARPFTFDRVVRLVIAIVLIGIAIWLIGILKNVLLPFCLACLLSYIMEPLVEFNQRLLHFKGRVAAVFLTIFDVTALFIILFYFFIPVVIQEFHQMELILKKYASSQVTIPFLPTIISEEI